MDHNPHPPYHAQQHSYPFAPVPVPAAFGAPPVITNSAVFGATSADAATSNRHVVEAPLHSRPPLRYIPSIHPPYVDMICIAIAGLNEPEGSSEQAISRFIKRVYSCLPPAHDALLAHYLTCLKNTGVLVMVQNSYKFSTSPPSSSALEAFRFDSLISTNEQNRNLSDSNALPQKRCRGRPPKAKPESQILGGQPKTADRVVVQPNLQDDSNAGQEQPNISVSEHNESETLVAKRRPGRPRKNGAQMQTATVNAFMRHRGRPLGRRGPGRPRKPKSVTASAMVNGVRRRGRPKRVESVVGVPAVAEGRTTRSSSMRQGRPPKIGGVVGKPMKPLSRRGRPVIQNNAAVEELKKKLDFFIETVKRAIGVLKAEIGSENQAAVSAIRELEGLVATNIDDAAAVPAEKVQTQSPLEVVVEAVAQGRVVAMQIIDH